MGGMGLEPISQEEQELKMLIQSIKNTLIEIPYDFVYEDEENSEIRDEEGEIVCEIRADCVDRIDCINDNIEDEEDNDRFRWQDEELE